jgi:signal transduction histidine kinase
VFVNLLSNALKFTAPRDRAVITVSNVPGSADEVVIEIRDNGVGFDPTYVQRLFGVFQRLHNRTEFDGTGIGLVNVRRIISRHGGRVWAQGAVDRGASFFIALPKEPS